MSIKPLPPDVVAQVKSSSVITSLNAVVLGLLRNSLDAQACKVNVSVDYRLGNCSVEDDGVGIPCAEFGQDGGLGKPHFTSKYPFSEGVYGRHGLFIYSVASLSLLSVTSHHRLQNSHNSLIVHNSHVVSRHIPALPSQEIMTFPHGTRVTVRDLFGSMPVRVKQRALEAESPRAGRDWDHLVRIVVALLLAFPGNVSVNLRETSSARALNLRACSDELASRTSHLLSRAALWDHGGTNRWVPLGASSSGITVDGCISMLPAPTRRLQFISFGIEPLSEDLGSNILFGEVNKVFANSKFGAIEDSAGQESRYWAPADTDKEYTTGELRVKKGVERWPVFYMRISLGARHATNLALHPDDMLDERHTSLPMIVDLLKAISYTFLKKYHFSPQRVNLASKRKSRTTPSGGGAPSGHGSRNSCAKTGGSCGTGSGSSDEDFGVRPATTAPKEPPGSEHKVLDSEEYARAQISALPGDGNRAEIIPGDPTRLCRRVPVDPHIGDEKPSMTESAREGTSYWDDPVTRARSLVDARTGFIIPARPNTTPQGSESPKPSTGGRARSGSKEPSPWLKDVLSRWNNPVFEMTEQSIPRLPDVDATPSWAPSNHKDGGICSVSLGHREDKASLAVENRISKADLAVSEVISQVDQKFILVKVPVSGRKTRTLGMAEDGGDVAVSEANLLVLIDQHAADERCRVETLMQDYFEDVSGNSAESVWRARTEHLEQTLCLALPPQDCALLERFRFHFERWGILYTISGSRDNTVAPHISTAPSTSAKGRDSMKLRGARDHNGVWVTSLPPAIVERCRTEPKMLAELLRTEAWRLEGDESLARSAVTAQGYVGSKSEHEVSTSWISRFHGCPRGVLDLINSRACRSAIMFNDPLSLDDCRKLLDRLSVCAFPFQCAHGRPSMVPLLDLGPRPPLVDINADFGNLGPGYLSQFTSTVHSHRLAA